jgi:hypothetical protein
MEDLRKNEANDLFRAYLSRPSEAEAEPILAKLISEQAEPIVVEIVRYKVRADRDSEDLRNNILLQLISRLRHLRESPAQKPIRSFRDYVAVVSYNACGEHFRHKNPHWQTLKDQLRYVVAHDSDFTSWKENGRRVCGFREWMGRPAANREAVEQAAGAPSGSKVSDRIRKIFRALEAPAFADDLLTVLAHHLPSESISEITTEDLAHPQQDVESTLSLRAHLREAWNEICLLPVPQRIALLLSLRDADGEAILAVLPASGIATIRQIAQTLEMPAEQFAMLWNGLPLEDLKIAQILKVTRQQVINLRKSARQRILRRVG